MRTAAGTSATQVLGDALALAATPVLASLAVLQALSRTPEFCSPMSTNHIEAMTVMYAVMALFHAKPWLAKLARSSAAPSQVPARAITEQPGGN